jgi:hypothetical protein
LKATTRSPRRGSRTGIFLAALLTLASVAPSHAVEMWQFSGTWIIRSSLVAPWADRKHPLAPEEPARLIGKAVRFSPGRVEGPAPLGCARPVYAVKNVAADMIFEGALAEPRDKPRQPDAAAAARELGFFDPGRIATLDAGCTELQIHELKPGTLVFGLNDRIYSMTRK